ncbi:MAG: tyrosine-type recombinase/integrase [Chitinophagales bacterium]|nr:tyrosine-type recombinase/integrase [Hyphomicrobiales bacterium]
MGRGSSLMRKAPKYCHGYIDCRGKPRWYLRRPGFKRAPLPGLPWSPSFMAAYEAAMAGEKLEPGKCRSKPGSVSDLVASYYQTAAFIQLSQATRTTYRGILERFREAHGDKPVAKLEEQHISAILDGMADTPAAANNLRRMLKAIMKLAKKRRLISHNPMNEIEPIKYKVKGFTDWSDADISQFASLYAIGARERLALELLVCAGPRRSDVIRLGPQHVIDGRLRYRQRKTGAEIDIPVLSDLNAAIDCMQLDGDTFLSTQFGKPFTQTGFYNWFKDKTLKAGLPKDRSPHGLRKACCRRLAEAGCSPHEIMSVSGHATLKEIERYTRAANRSRLADSAMTTLTNARNRNEKLSKEPIELANIRKTVSQSKRQTVNNQQLSFWNGGVGGIRTPGTHF